MNKGLSLVLISMLSAMAMVDALAEEYMKRGATVEDYEQALNRVMERKRGLVTGRERQPSATSTQPSAQGTRSTGGSSQSQTASRPVAQPTASRAPSSVSTAARPASPPAEPGVYRPSADEAGQDGVSIYFGYDSARLTEEAMEELSKLGQALARPQFGQVTWLIEGHTDATGSDDYNQRLSERRAQAAERYLIECCGIDPRRLIAVGKGERELYDPDRPAAAINRRVRVRPIGE